MTKMKAIILAAGEGKRMRPLTYEKPKVMLPIAGKPIIEHLLVEVKEVGIDDFIFVVGYHDETIRGYFGNGERWDINLEYITQKTQLGTADALRKAEDLVKNQFLMLNGDTIVSAKDIKNVINNGVNMVLGVIEVENPADYGVVETEGGRITKIHEKMRVPISNLVNAGVYALDESIFGVLSKTDKSKRGELELTDSLQLLIDSGEAILWEKIECWLDLSYPWNLLTANEFMIGNLSPVNRGEVEENVIIDGDVSIGEGTVIKSGTYIEGPVFIGDNCVIGPNSYIRANTAIGDNCHIGNAVEVKNSVIMDGTKIPHLSYLGDSVIGSRCNLGAGTKIANLRFNDAQIIAKGMDTGRRKLGAIMGDGVKTGINACIDAGTIIGNNTLIGPGAVASGNIEKNSRVY
ncbi:bifunctional UDP-N-acetylglucosamine pyrophosphorylase / Glucosamine-1-phosphate N-acetyltransferase [Methanophagales archaeon]|nr:bifunctional UDP-N-acetylglucosamine pyrophosphorylase / Glucosamine-1-phosphate N-acetyltransferase [Methanophagales archaeon]